MAHLSYEESKKNVVKGLYLLAAVTVIEVLASLLGRGHLIPGLEKVSWLFYILGLIIAFLSFYKARYIIYEFMHLKYEVKGLAWTILLPTTLLIWAIIAFFWEGDSWKKNRLRDHEPVKVEQAAPAQESLNLDEDVFILDQKS